MLFFVSISRSACLPERLRQTKAIIAAKNFKSASEEANGANRMESATPIEEGECKR